MSIKNLQLIAAMSAPVQKHFASLPEDKATEFLAKSAADQEAEVTAIETAKSQEAARLAAEAEKAKSAPTGEDVVTLKSQVSGLQAELEVLKGDKATTALKQKAAKEYPGVPDAYEVMDSIKGLTEAQQAPVLKSLRTRADLAKRLGTVFGDPNPVVGDGTAKARYNGVVAEVAKSKSITTAEAELEVAQDPQHADLVEEMREEEGEAAYN